MAIVHKGSNDLKIKIKEARHKRYRSERYRSALFWTLGVFLIAQFLVSDYAFELIWSIPQGLIFDFLRVIFDLIQLVVRIGSTIALFSALIDNYEALGPSDEENILQTGQAGEYFAIWKLSQLPNEYHIFTNLKVPFNDGFAELDCLVVGPTGLFIFEIKTLRGTLYGDWSDEYLIKEKHQDQKKIYNPLRQVGGHAYKLSQYLKDNGLREWIEKAIIFVHPDIRLGVSDENYRQPHIFYVTDESILDFVKENSRLISAGKVNQIVRLLEHLISSEETQTS